MAVLDDNKIVLPELDESVDNFGSGQYIDPDELAEMDPESMPVAEETLFTWSSMSRVQRAKPSKKYYLNLGLIILLIVLILIFANQFSLLMVVLALTFLAYVLVHTKPEMVRHTITNFGIRTDNKYFAWTERGEYFWFEENHGQKLVIVETRKFPYRITMLAGNAQNAEKIKQVLQMYLVNKKPEAGRVDKIISWWKEKFPLE